MSRTHKRIVARVNGAPITAGDVHRRGTLILAELRAQNLIGLPHRSDANLSVCGCDALRDEIDHALLAQRAEVLGVDVSAEVDLLLARIQAHVVVTGRENLSDWIQEESGISLILYRARLTDETLARVLSQEDPAFNSGADQPQLHSHSDRGLALERVLLREILIVPRSGSEANIVIAQKRAGDIAARANAGENFEHLATEYSDAVGSKGALVAFWKRHLRPELAAAVSSAAIGSVTDPVRTPRGFHLLKVEQRTDSGAVQDDGKANPGDAGPFRGRSPLPVRHYLRQLRRDAKIEIREGYVDTGEESAVSEHQYAWNSE